MYYYRVDFSREALQRDPEEPERLLQEVRRMASLPPILPSLVRYRKMSGADGSTALWFAFERPEVDRLLVTIDSLKPYTWTPVQRPVWPDPEWRGLA